MATVDIIKLKIRRGTNTQRKLVTLDQGEPGWTTDTNRLYIGDGSTLGGIAASPFVFGEITSFSDPILSDQAAKNDIAYINSFLYALTADTHTGATDWRFIGTVPDNTALQYNASNKMTIREDGVSAVHIAPDVAGDGLNHNAGQLQVKVDNNTIIIDPIVGLSATGGGGGGTGSPGVGLNKVGNTFNVRTDNTTISANVSNDLVVIGISNDVITSPMIQQSTLGDGLTGGFGAAGGSTLRVAVDNSTIVLENGVLSAIPGAVATNSIDETHMKSSAFTNGLTGGSGIPISVAVDSAAGFAFNGDGITLSDLSVPVQKISNENQSKLVGNSQTVFLPTMTVNVNGIITSLTASGETFTQADSAANAEDLYAVVAGPGGQAYAVQLYTFAGSATYTF